MALRGTRLLWVVLAAVTVFWSVWAVNMASRLESKSNEIIDSNIDFADHVRRANSGSANPREAHWQRRSSPPIGGHLLPGGAGGGINNAGTIDENAGKNSPLVKAEFALHQLAVLKSEYDERQAKLKAKSDKASCVHTQQRDYSKHPIQTINGDAAARANCPVPCDYGTLDIGGSQAAASGGCAHVKSLITTMENSGYEPKLQPNPLVIRGTPHSNADVFFQYGSWAEYNYMRPPDLDKQHFIIAMISNCGPKKRLEWIQGLIDNGALVHSAGTCLNNYHLKVAQTSTHRLRAKIAAIRKYKFIMAFENSVAPGYITEKLFGPLVAGVVPIYFGAPDARKWAPSGKSVIWAEDFASPAELAKYLLYLDRNDTAYREYLDWKVKGPSDEFIAQMDISLLHSACRICVRAADLDRRFHVGPVSVGDPFFEANQVADSDPANANKFLIKVRAQNEFWFQHIYLSQLTVAELHATAAVVLGESHGRILWSYRLWDQHRSVLDDADLGKFEYGEEVVAVCTDPHVKRLGYSEWLNGNPVDKDDFT